MPTGIKNPIKNILGYFHLPNWLVIVLVLVIIFRIPSLFEPYSYGDEMIYLTLGQGIRQGFPLYKTLHDNKPPLLYIMAAVAGNLIAFKAILLFWSLITIVMFWHLVRYLFPKNQDQAKFAVIFFSVLTTIPLLEGNIANAELFFLGPIIAAFLIILKKPATFLNLFSAGVCFSVAVLFKFPAIFDFLAVIFLFFIFFLEKKITFSEMFRRLFVIGFGILTPIVVTFLWYYFRGAGTQYIIAAFAQNLGYVSSWRPEAQTAGFLTKNGPLLFRFFLAVAGNLILIIFRKKLPRAFLLTVSWLLFTLFAVALSERPYPHYFLQAVPPLCILLSIFFTDKTRLQTLAIFPLTLAFIVPVYFKFWYYPTAPYYLRFINLLTGRISRQDYLKSFDSKIPRNYEVAKTIIQITENKDQIYVWGDTAIIYALTRRLPPVKYVADYHIRDFSSKAEVIKQLQANPPKAIVILPEGENFFEINTFLNKQYVLITEIDGAKIYKHIVYLKAPRTSELNIKNPRFYLKPNLSETRSASLFRLPVFAGDFRERG